jgi:signal transduction histidine kinase
MRLFRRLLQLPLEMKLLIPNVVVIAIAATAFATAHGSDSLPLEYLAISVLVTGAIVNFMVVRIALRPVKAIQFVAEEVARGNLAARVAPSAIADPNLAHLAVTFNETLEYLGEAREEIRERGARIVYAQERERAGVARELHESIGQTLAAASFQAAAAVKAAVGHPPEAHCLEVAELLRVAMEDLRNVSRDLHPRVADDLGLPAALDALAHSTMDRSLIDVRLTVKGSNELITSPVSSTLYRIAMETLKSIEANSTHGTVDISLVSDSGAFDLEINYDCTFDSIANQRTRESLGALSERLSLLGGNLTIDTNLDGGMRVRAHLQRQQEAA